MKEKMNRFAFRKLSVGLASVAVAAFAGSSLVAAEEVKPAQPVAGESVSTNANQGFPEGVSENGPIATTVSEIATSATQATVAADQAKVGDVVAVETTPPTTSFNETKNGNVETGVATIETGVKTTTLVDPATPVEKKEPVVTQSESSSVSETSTEKVTRREQVIKTVTEEVTKEADTIVKQTSGGADIVFVLDHTVSMDDEIAAVKKNITDFVNGIASKGISVRLGLADYATEATTNYADFNGSRFTSDVPTFIAALDKIRTSGGTEEASTVLAKIAKEYDWSPNANTKRFAVLVTDEDYDILKNSTSVEDMIKALKAANISATVISDKGLESTYKSLYTETNGLFTDIKTDFSKVLLGDVANWVVESVQKGNAYKVVNEQYKMIFEVTVERKMPATVTTPSTPATPTKYVPAVSATKAEKIPVTTQKTFIQSAKELPHTGYSPASTAAIAGMALGFFTLALSAFKRKFN